MYPTTDHGSKIEALAAQLGGTARQWTHPSGEIYHPYGRIITLAYGLEIFVNTDWKSNDKLNATLHLENGLSAHKPYRDQQDWPSVSVGAGRPLDKLAADITRRLLPDARAYLAECIKRKAEHDDTADQTQAIAQRLALAGGLKVRGEISNNDYPRLQLIGYTQDGPSVDAEIFGESITIDLHNLTLGQAEAVLVALKAAQT